MEEFKGMTESGVRKLSEALSLCQRELAQVRGNQEPLLEEISLLRSENHDMQAVSEYLAQALADQLSRVFWDEHQPTAPVSWRRFIGSRWPWLKRHFGSRRSAGVIAELGQIRLIEASSLFQSAWYLKQYADVAQAGINPATHYLRSGALEGRDPGPDFSTRDHVAQHPELDERGLNPLVHFLQSQST